MNRGFVVSCHLSRLGASDTAPADSSLPASLARSVPHSVHPAQIGESDAKRMPRSRSDSDSPQHE